MFLNQGAGSARSDRVRRAVELARRALDADLHVTATRDVDELTAWLGERVAGYDTAIIAGGDGSLGAAFGVAAARGGLALGYIPAGFGNATQHLLRLPSEPEAIAEVLDRGDARPVDLVEVDGRLALFASAGWDAIVAGRYAEGGARRLPGWTAAVARSVPDLWRQSVVEVRADGWVVHHGRLELAVVGTTPFYGRGLRVNPGARWDEGVLSLRVYSGSVPRFVIEAARWALRVAPRSHRIAAREVTIRSLDGRPLSVQADGDLVGSRVKWAFALRPEAVRLIGNWD